MKCFSLLIEEVALKDTKKRLVKFLLDISQDQRSKGIDPNKLSIPFTREEIAQRLGMTRETVARNLSQLKSSKIIEFQPKQIIIRKLSDLEKLLD